MGKETKEILKTLLSNQELIMKHLGIAKSASTENKKEVKPEMKKTVVKSVAKQVRTKKR